MFLQLARQMSFQLYNRSLPAALPCTGIWIQRYSLHQENFQCYLQQRNVNTSSDRIKEESLSQKIKEEFLVLKTLSHKVKQELFDKVKQELIVFKTVDFNELKNAPYPAKLYGFGGVLPFALPFIYFLGCAYSPFLTTSQLTYGATILAFVGGVKWGNALAKGDVSHIQIGISTIPSLVAWSALLVPEPLGLLFVSSGLLGVLYIDLVSSRYPPWFCAMRSALTGIAVTSLMTTFLMCILN